MNTKIKTIVTFKSSTFNMSEPKPYFINPSCFGDDVAKWLTQALRSSGYQANEPGQEDFGWYCSFMSADVKHNFVIGHHPGERKEENRWIGWIERTRGLSDVLRGIQKTDIEPSVIQAIHKILTESQQIEEIRWHWESDFNGGREELGTESPF